MTPERAQRVAVRLVDHLTGGEADPRAVGTMTDLIRLGLFCGRIQVREAAEYVHVSRRALSRRLNKADLPPPSRCLILGALAAAMLSYAGGKTLAEAAYRHNWSDPYALSNSMKRHLGVRPSTVRHRVRVEGPELLADLMVGGRS